MIWRGFNALLLVLLKDPIALMEKVDKNVYVQGFQLTGPIALTIIYVLLFLGSGLGSYGLAIVVMTILVRLLLLNLTISQIRMMKLNQYLAPLARQIQKKYKDDKVVQNQKLMLLYQHFRLSPLSGCLAIILQFIILFGVYRALYDPVFLGETFWGIQILFPMNLYYARSFGKGVNLQSLIFNYIDEHNLSSQVLTWSKVIGDKTYSWAIYWPALVLVLFYILTSLAMQRFMRKISAPDPRLKELFPEERKNKGEKSQDFAEVMQRQTLMINVMLVLIAFILSAGALLYFIMQNILMMIEYKFVPRMLKLSYSHAELNSIMDAIYRSGGTEEKAERGIASVKEESVANPDEQEEEEILRIRKPFSRKK